VHKVIITTLILAIAISPILAIDDDAGVYGFQFLKIPAVPTMAAMGGTGEMLQRSPLTILAHPAAFSWQRGAYLATSHTAWLVDTSLFNIAFRNIMFDKSFGLAIKYVDHGEFDKRTDNGTHIGYYYPLDINLALNYAQKVTPDIHAGITANVIYEKIDSSSALGFAADLGLVYLTPLRNTSLDIAFKNVGFSTKMDNEKVKLPFITELGITYGYEFTEDFALYPALKAVYMNDHDDILPAIGLDFRIMEILSLKAGYKLNYDEEDLSAGFGVAYKNFNLDYSYMNFNNDLNAVHIFGLGYRF